MNPPPSLLSALEVASQLAREAGHLIRAHRPLHVETKGGPIDLVTETDKACETLIARGLAAAFPKDGLLAEEGGESRPSLSGRRWVVDPLDGTTNFVHGIERVAVSIGLMEGEQILVGVVLDAFLDRLYGAVLGGGAHCNALPIAVSPVPSLEVSILATGFPYDRRQRAAFYLDYTRAFMERSHGIRRFGSAALDLCDVAAGRFDGFFEFGLSPWDTTAGALLVTEAGGRLSDGRGGAWHPGDRLILASNGRIHEEMIRVITSVEAKEQGV